MKKRFNAFRDGKIHVCEHACSTCIFRDDSVIPRSRVEEMVRLSLHEDTGIICHSTLETDANAICRGFFNRHKSDTASLRLAQAFGVIAFQQEDKS